MRTLLTSLLLTVACGGGNQSPTTVAAPPPAQGGSGPQSGGEEPPPPPDVGAQAGLGQIPAEYADRAFDVAGDAGVNVTGTITYTGVQNGEVVLQVITMKPDPERSLRENRAADFAYVFMEHSKKLTAPGPFNILVPKSFGEATLVAFLDVTSNGVSSDDPAGRLDVTISEGGASGLVLAMSDTPDLGNLTPGGN